MRDLGRWSTLILVAALALGWLAFPSGASAQSSFRRGDCNADGSLNVGDPIFLLAILFSGGAPGPCTDACDGNDDGGQDIGDAIYVLTHLFSGGAPPPPPTSACGADPTADGIGCASFPPCAPVAEVCNNLIDDDGDGDVDCNDADCASAPNCLPLSHATDIQPLWTARCISCHSGILAPQGLVLTAGTAYGMIVGVSSAECPPMDRVAPGLPQQSFLFRKVTGTQAAPDVTGLGCSVVSVGAQMPFGIACCLSQAERDLIEDWIATGANP
jgi:hypothetical protein